MNNCFIGLIPTHDGMGARFQRVLTALALSFELGVDYLHTPMTYEGFGITQSMGDKLRDKSYIISNSVEYLNNAKLWDIGVNYNGVLVTDIDISKYEIIRGEQNYVYSKLKEDIRHNTNNGKIYLFDSLHRLLWSKIIDVENINKHKDKIKSKFDLNHDMTNEIIIHIRRKDIIKYSDRMLDDSYYLNLINQLSNKYGSDNILITTQRENFNFELYKNYKILYDDESTEIESIKRMINSKILVISLSSFSVVAAYLSNGNVIVPKKLKKEEKLKNWSYGI
jgi:hypothetical protein